MKEILGNSNRNIHVPGIYQEVIFRENENIPFA